MILRDIRIIVCMMIKANFVVNLAMRVVEEREHQKLQRQIKNPVRRPRKMSVRRVIGGCFVTLLLSAQGLIAAGSDIADAAMNKNKDALRSLLQKKADVNAPQVD